MKELWLLKRRKKKKGKERTIDHILCVLSQKGSCHCKCNGENCALTFCKN